MVRRQRRRLVSRVRSHAVEARPGPLLHPDARHRPGRPHRNARHNLYPGRGRHRTGGPRHPARTGRAEPVVTDLAQEESIRNLVRVTSERFGRLDILVNNAGITHSARLEETRTEDLDRCWTINARAPFLLCRQAGEIMCKQGYGKIVNVADIAGTKVWADFIPYTVSKAGLLALTSGLAKALAPAVQVNAVAPGVVLLPDDSAPEERARTVKRVPLRRLGTPGDMARAVVYLVESDFVTGDVLTVDGGQRLL